ncbi:hypothetical protein [Roseovarius salis]|uniref:hypothetical protein n=1 Tax=Roseovarius salis TaxID=3376063 RepID=UPI0037CC7D54
MDEQLSIARAATPEELRRLARCYDWSTHPETVLGWIMAQKVVDIGTALTVFFNGGPERFNYMSKREVPQAHRGAARVLDNICLRVNCGFYRVRAGQKVDRRARIDRWIAYQQADREEGRRGRWILDEGIVEEALKGRSHQWVEGDAATLQPLRARAAGRGVLSWLSPGELGRQLHGILPRRG